MSAPLQSSSRRGKASISYLQRKLAIGYNRAANLIERMEGEGIVGPARSGADAKFSESPTTLGAPASEAAPANIAGYNFTEADCSRHEK